MGITGLADIHRDEVSPGASPRGELSANLMMVAGSDVAIHVEIFLNYLSDALLDFWQVRNLMTCLQFEQFYSLISHISALRRYIIHCSQLVLIFLQSYFTCCG